MFGSNLSKATREMKSLVSEAEQLIRETNSMTGEKADTLQKQGLKLLDAGLSKAHDMQDMALKAGKDAANSANEMVHENPWRAMAVSGVIAASVGLAVGLAIPRK
ncbi:MAG TPA: DUF883 domain-containing protein [Oxalobacteraceae bacterium]|nr:DUF883 domain-containing protein [Oxalobacteraceae bacterium]